MITCSLTSCELHLPILFSGLFKTKKEADKNACLSALQAIERDAFFADTDSSPEEYDVEQSLQLVAESVCDSIFDDPSLNSSGLDRLDASLSTTTSMSIPSSLVKPLKPCQTSKDPKSLVYEWCTRNGKI
jgi:hypothetical protein